MKVWLQADMMAKVLTFLRDVESGEADIRCSASHNDSAVKALIIAEWGKRAEGLRAEVPEDIPEYCKV